MTWVAIDKDGSECIFFISQVGQDIIVGQTAVMQ